VLKVKDNHRIWVRKETKDKILFIAKHYDATIYNVISTLIEREYRKINKENK